MCSGARLCRCTQTRAAGLVDLLEEWAAGLLEREMVDEADVLEHLCGTVSGELVRSPAPAGAQVSPPAHPEASFREPTSESRKATA
jgi:hypothetical protein